MVNLNHFMDFTSFLTHLSQLKDAPLGGMESQFKMAPELRLNYTEELIAQRNPRYSAVLALFYPNRNNETHFLLTQRARYNGTHSAQISLPGGKIEQQDKNLCETAIRETFEETGVNMSDISIFREVTKTYIPPSNFWVIPFIGTIEYTPIFKASNEVHQFIEVSLSALIDDNSLASENMTTSYMQNIDVPCFKLNNYIVWGATAMILSEIKDLLKPL